MARLQFMHKAKCFRLFLNVSFVFIIICLTTHLSTKSDLLRHFKQPNSVSNSYEILDRADIGCKGLHDHQDKCFYVRSQSGCQSSGYISYLTLFYCIFSPVLGYAVLILWLLVLFYLLGDTAANYFCFSLEGLSSILKLSPSIAGVTLLSLGNGSPDLFSSIVSFTGDATKNVGLNSILGGAFFVSSTVVGIISISASHQDGISISKSGFIRDVIFLILSLSFLLLIIAFGKINLWGALAFISLYFIYIFFVASSQICCRHQKEGEVISDNPSILPVDMSFSSNKPEESSDLGAPLLASVEDGVLISIEDDKKNLKGFEERERRRCLILESSRIFFFGERLLQILQLPLDLPRRLTIPVVSEEKWSKPYAVISVTIAPVLLATIWNLKGPNPSFLDYAFGGSVGIIFGVVVYFNTDSSYPPTKCLFAYLAGGFMMSIIWTYVMAQELISLLVSLGLLLGISPSILGLTVLAWGNSLGDLVADLSMAKNGGPSGVQVAISGCYAGPMFNLVVGLGLSLSFMAWKEYPSYFSIPKDPFVFETLGFFMGGLLWTLIVLPKKKMRLDGQLGVGLLAIYFCFLFVKIARTLGLIGI